LAGLSSLGLPGTAGFVAELLVFVGAWGTEHSWWAIPGVLGAFLTADYVLRAIKIIFWGPGPVASYHDLRDARRSEWGALWILGTALVVFGVWPALVLDFIDKTTPSYLAIVLGVTR
jgi:NADH-quinone oxidoreductase subunit M